MPDHNGDYGLIAAGLDALAREVERTWRAEDYPAAVRTRSAQFRHALIHAVKATGKLAALCDHADHDSLGSDEATGLQHEIPKLVADLVRCAAKMAEMAPGYGISLSAAYLARSRQLAERWDHVQEGDNAD